jgi:hypothetical protein
MRCPLCGHDDARIQGSLPLDDNSWRSAGWGFIRNGVFPAAPKPDATPPQQQPAYNMGSVGAPIHHQGPDGGVQPVDPQAAKAAGSQAPAPNVAGAVSASASRSSSGPSNAPAGLHFDKARKGPVKDQKGPVVIVSHVDGHKAEVTVDRAQLKNGDFSPTYQPGNTPTADQTSAHPSTPQAKPPGDMAVLSRKDGYTTSVTTDPKKLQNFRPPALPIETVRDPNDPVVIVNRIDGTQVTVDRDKFKKGDFSLDKPDQPPPPPKYVPPEDRWGPPNAQGIRKPSFRQMQDDFVIFRSQAQAAHIHYTEGRDPPDVGDAINTFYGTPTGQYFLSLPTLFKARRDFDKYVDRVAYTYWGKPTETADYDEERLYNDVEYGHLYLPPSMGQQ